MKMYVKNRAAWIDANLLSDVKVPTTPTITYTGSTNFPANHLAFRCSDFSGEGAFAAMKWRVGEVAEPNLSVSKAKAPLPCEITPVWESEELTTLTRDLVLPPGVLTVGHTYRVRVRLKDANGCWSHWSAPVQFTLQPSI